MTQIVWNGCDGYIEVDDAVRRGYDFDGNTLYKGSQEFTAFTVVEINVGDLPKDLNGEPDFDGVFGSEIGRAHV